MNPNEKIAVIFPAFVTEFIGCETDELQALGVNFNDYLNQAVAVCGKELLFFDIREQSYVQDELMIQYITYIYSCAVSDILRKSHLQGDFVSGYSMGIYAALYHAGSISFTDGLKAIQQAYRAIQNAIPSTDYTMGLTGGLEFEDVSALLKKTAANTYIINSNNRHTFVYSGPRSEVENLIIAAKEEGALMTRVMNVSIPYHSPYLQKTSVEFSAALQQIKISSPQMPLISSLSQQSLTNEAEIKQELVDNLHHPFHWFRTIQYFLAHQTSLIIESGAGEGLSKINKFIPGDYRTLNLKTIRKYLNS